MRPILSYEDIASPVTPVVSARAAVNGRSNLDVRRGGRSQGRSTRVHWDGPGSSSSQHVPYDEHSTRRDAGDSSSGPPAWEWKSRDLTHEEIWDDSALIEAWDSAMEEYEVLNGPNKDWKMEPVHQSPLWYNVPGHTRRTDPECDINGDISDDQNSRPADFDHFVPTHDPSLAANPDINTSSQSALRSPFDSNGLLPEDGNLPADELFQKVTHAWYWAGYWTAMFHAAKQNGAKRNVVEDSYDERDDNEGDGEMLPVQRD